MLRWIICIWRSKLHFVFLRALCVFAVNFSPRRRRERRVKKPKESNVLKMTNQTPKELFNKGFITEEQFNDVIHKQYVKKFARFGDAVVTSNMKVMNDGFSLVQEIKYGEITDADRSSNHGSAPRS